jgi:hypothetical protein
MTLSISYQLHDHMVLTVKLQMHLYSGLSKFVPIVSLHVSLPRLLLKDWCHLLDMLNVIIC